MSEGFTVNSKHTLTCAIKWLTDNFEQHKYSTYSVRHGADRSLDQNALFHVWALEYGCFLAKIHPKGLESLTKEAIIEQTKRAAKRRFYSEFRYSWLVIKLKDPFTGDEKKDFRSSRKYKTAEMFEFLTWLQATATNDGCPLESKGKFDKLQRESK